MGSEEKLLGLWKCYKQDLSAPAPECLHSIEFLKDGTMYQNWWLGKLEISKHTFSVNSDRITVVNKKDKIEWQIKYSFLQNGDLRVKMGQWNFEGILTKDYDKVPSDYGCKFHSFTKN